MSHAAPYIEGPRSRVRDVADRFPDVAAETRDNPVTIAHLLVEGTHSPTALFERELVFDAAHLT